MSQIKDTARSGATPSRDLRSLGGGTIDGKIAGLLERRERLVQELVLLDRKLADLRAESRRGDPSGVDTDTRWFPIRGEQAIAGRFPVPPGLDEEDLQRRLRKILVDERRSGRSIEGLELLVAFQPAGGRVLSVRSRRPGDARWVRRFEALGRTPGH